MDRAKELTVVRQKFWPRVDAKGAPVKPDSTDCLVRHKHDGAHGECKLSPSGGYSKESQKLERDNNVVWVGSLVRALVHFGIFPGYHQAKSFFFDSADSNVRLDTRTGKPLNASPRQFRLGFERCSKLVGTWPYNDSKYSERLYLHSIVGSGLERSQDPGEVIDSPTVRTDDKDLWTQTTAIEFNPTIAVDTRLGLHILRRGDKLIKATSIPRAGQNAEERREIFVLRSIAEGTSRVPVVAGEAARMV